MTFECKGERENQIKNKNFESNRTSLPKRISICKHMHSHVYNLELKLKSITFDYAKIMFRNNFIWN